MYLQLHLFLLVLAVCTALGGTAFAIDDSYRILLSNDDGIGTKQIAALAAALGRNADVVVVAPSGNRSGSSHSSTTLSSTSKLAVRPVHKDGVLFGYSVDGTPAVFLNGRRVTELCETPVFWEAIAHDPVLRQEGMAMSFAGQSSSGMDRPHRPVKEWTQP